MVALEGETTLALKDLTGFYGRCDAVLLTTDTGYVPPEDKDAVCKERARMQGLSLEPEFAGDFDVIVVGGGSAGVPAAIAAARMGAKTALIQNRPTLGGNGSVEAGVGWLGAGKHHPGWMESGLAAELSLQRAQLGQINYSDASMILCEAEPNLTLYLNQHVFDAVMEGESHISGVKSVSTLTGLVTEYKGTIFIDCTGDGWLGYYAGAKYRRGREASSEFDESLAPYTADGITMSGCIMGDGNGYMTAFRSMKTDQPVEFVRPEWIKPIEVLEAKQRQLRDRVPTTGTWWMEHPGKVDDTLHAEEARDDLIKVSLAFWDYVKNRSDVIEEARTYDLVMIPILDAKRESRRLVGDYMVNQNDVATGRLFYDRIAYCGWKLDIHHPGGIYSGEEGPFDFFEPAPINSVPFRSIYSRNIDNLMMAGRCLSYSHVALGTVRVQATLATIGQAAGTAAAICAEKGMSPRELGKDYIGELQQVLLKNDQTIQGIKNEDPNDLARNAKVTASSFDRATTVKIEKGKTPIPAKRCFKPENVINGWRRLVQSPAAMWRSDPVQSLPQWIELDFGKPIALNTLQLVFDFEDAGKPATMEVIPEQVKDYEVEAFVDGRWLQIVKERDNFQRFRRHQFLMQKASKLRLTISATHGGPFANVYEIRVYKE